MKNALTLFILLFSLQVIAQDKIIKKSGDLIQCKVTELGAAEVKYHYTDNPKLVFGIDNALVERVEFSTGEVIEIGKNSFNNPEYYAGQSRNALKLNFLSPLFGSTEFVFERTIKPGKSWETSLGIIGLGLDPQENNAAGVYTKFAYKFMRNPDFYMQKMHYAHLLKGAYIAPEIAFRYMSFDSYNYNYYGSYNSSKKKENAATLAILLKFGKQWVFDDSFLVDVFWGVGYGFGGLDDEGLTYGFIAGTDETPIAVTGGIRIGWVFGK